MLCERIRLAIRAVVLWAMRSSEAEIRANFDRIVAAMQADAEQYAALIPDNEPPRRRLR